MGDILDDLRRMGGETAMRAVDEIGRLRLINRQLNDSLRSAAAEAEQVFRALNAMFGDRLKPPMGPSRGSLPPLEEEMTADLHRPRPA